MDTLEKWHGTAGGYANQRCRCSPCRAAWAKMARDRREKRIQEGYFEGADVGHGKYSTYAAGCRCDLCAEAQTQYAYTSRLARRSAPEKPYNSECACCHRIRELHLDHDHVTGDFRGWICRTCNTGIGKLGDNIAGLERAIEYLKGN